jgi:hypothetical protein
VELNVTALTITFLDVGGNALNAPVSSYSLRSPNSTTNTGLSALSYPQVQFGTYTISVIYYGGNDVTPTASLTKSVTSSSSWTIDLAVSIGPGSGGGSGGGNNPIVTVQPVHTAPYLPPTKQQTPAASLESIEQSLQAPIFGIPAWIMLAAVILVLVYYKKK